MPADRPARLARSHRMIETTWQCNPMDGLCFLGMTGEVAFPMRILNDDKTTGWNVPDSPSLVTYSTEPLGRTESTRSGTVCQLTWRKPAGDASEADARCRIMRR